jgi:type I restriction enzyme S subunit
MKKQIEVKQTEIRTIPENWEFYTVGDVAEVVGGGTPSTKDTNNFGGEIPWITPKDLSNYPFRYIQKGERNITKKGLENSSAKLVPKGTVLLTTRAPVGYVAIAENEVTTNQGFRSLIPKNNFYSEFIYYLLKLNTEYLKSHASGTTFGELSGSTLKSLKFAFPPFEEQHAIASILGSLDDKIALNRSMNSTLEAIGQALFKHWFVDFEFPNEEGKLYGSGGGDMVETELGEVPKGWRVGTLGDIASNSRRGVSPEDIDPNSPHIGLEHMPRRNIALSDWDYAKDIDSNKFLFHRGDILFGKLRPYFHKVGITAVDGVCSTDILVVVPKNPIWFGLLLFHISSIELVNHGDATSTGTKMPRTNWADLARFQIGLPPNDVAEKFTDIIFPIIQKIQENILESRTLTAIRDALLPKLMSGEIRIEVK